MNLSQSVQDCPCRSTTREGTKLANCKKYYSKTAYWTILARMAYSTLRGYLKSSVRGDRVKVRAYYLSFLHHLRGTKGRTWV